MIIPLIESSVEANSETRVYLLEDAMELWSTVLNQAPFPTPSEIISLAQHVFPMYESASETLRRALDLTESYIYLIPEYLLVESPVLLTPFASLLVTTNREATGLITHLIELLIRSADSVGGTHAIATLTTHLVSTGFLATLLTGIHTAYSAHQTTGPNRASSIDGLVETDYLSVLARLALASPQLFLSALAATFPHDPVETTLPWLLTEWFSHFDNVPDPVKKKLNCLGLTALLDTNQPWILSRLQELMTIWTDVITELVVDEVDDNNKNGADCLIYWDVEALKGADPEAPIDERRRKLEFADPVRRVDIKAFVREKLAAAVVACGGREAFEQAWLVNVDADVVKGFGALGVI